MTTITLTPNSDTGALFTGTPLDDTYNGTYDAAVTDTFNDTDILDGSGGVDTLNIVHGTGAITPSDALWTGIRNIEKVVITATGNGAQTITTSTMFNAAFTATGVNLATTQNGDGAITLAMSTFTGVATLNATTNGSGAQVITTGTGPTAVTATISNGGAQTIKGIGLTTVTATASEAQTIGDAGGNGANLVSVTATSAAGDQIITSTSTNAVTVAATSAAGSQTIITGTGADVINASTTAAINNITTGDGNDRVTILATASGGYTINAGTGDDTVTGGAGNDNLLGDLGNDILDGGAAVDTMTGGDGSDLYYVDIATDVVSETNAIANIGGIDTVYSSISAYTLTANVENGQVMSSLAANLTGNSIDNILYAGAGDNILDGGLGTDTADYTYATSAVNANLALAIAQATGGSGADTLTSIESLTGSNFNDTLTGNVQDNRFNGGSGNDTVVGGVGNDRAVYAGIFTDYRITRSLDTIVVQDINPSNGNEGTDILTQVEFLDFSNTSVPSNIPATDIPVMTSGSTGSVAENAAIATAIYTATASDTDALSYSLKAATGDVASLAINAGTGVVTLLSPANFEAKASYSFTVVSTDSTGLMAELAVVANVIDVNEAPVFISGSTGSVAENAAIATVIYTAAASDVDAGDTRSYSLKAATGDVALLTINANTGAVTLLSPANFETKASYSFTVVSTDAGGLTAEIAVVANVTNVNEAPVFTSGSTGSVAENAPIATVLYTAAASDVDAGDTRSYSFKTVAGDDAALVSINANTGAVTLLSPANFETKASYSFTVVSTDAGGLTAEKAVVANVVNVNEAPVMTSGSTGSVAENTPIATVIYTAAASDVDAGDTRSYSLKAATGDVALLTINANTGAVTLKSPANFETKASYSFTVVSTDAGGLTAEKAVVANVVNVNEAPVFISGSTGSIAENAPIATVLYTAAASDVDAGDTRSYSFKTVAGDDAALVSINANTGAVTLRSPANFETKASYSFTVISTDAGGLTAEKAVVANVTNVNEAPVFTSGSTGSVAENVAIATVIYTAAASDVDAGDTRSYSFKTVAGDDAALVSINANTGAVTLRSPANFETKASYSFTVVSTDAGGLAAEKAVVANVTNVNEAPVFTSGSTGSVVENAAIATVIYTAAASDVDAGDTRSYS
ncbi:MAG: cadherin domain-containing protein, partial [Methylovulum sp.]|nr:cadherin domain-containing protein [Methylovulum sp.]